MTLKQWVRREFLKLEKNGVLKSYFVFIYQTSKQIHHKWFNDRSSDDFKPIEAKILSKALLKWLQ